MEFDTKPLQIQENKFRSHWNYNAPNVAKTNCWTFSSLPVPQTQSLIAVPRCTAIVEDRLQSFTNQKPADTPGETFQLCQRKRTKNPGVDNRDATTEEPEAVTVKVFAAPTTTTELPPPKDEAQKLPSKQTKSRLVINDNRLTNSKRTGGGAHLIDAPTPLLKALFDCDLNKARDLLQSKPGCVFDKDTKCCHSALLFACETDNALPIVKTMIETLGADVQVECRRGIIPLTAALHNYRSFPTPFNKELIDYILERTNQMDPKVSPPCDTPLFAAVRLGDVELVKAMLRKGANANLAIEGDRTALHRVSNAAVARVLIENGAHLDRQDSDGMTPLCSAALSGHVEVVRCLLEHKANPYICSHLGNPPIVCAAQGGHTDVVFLLHRLGGVPLGSETREYKATALHYAAKGNHLDLVTRLVGHKGVAIDAKTSTGLTPLFIAAKEGHVEVVKLLLKKGANPLAADGSNVMQMAKENGRTELYQELMINKRMKKALKAKKHKDSIRKVLQKVVAL